MLYAAVCEGLDVPCFLVLRTVTYLFAKVVFSLINIKSLEAFFLNKECNITPTDLPTMQRYLEKTQTGLHAWLPFLSYNDSHQKCKNMTDEVALSERYCRTK